MAALQPQDAASIEATLQAQARAWQSLSPPPPLPDLPPLLQADLEDLRGVLASRLR